MCEFCAFAVQITSIKTLDRIYETKHLAKVIAKKLNLRCRRCWIPDTRWNIIFNKATRIHYKQSMQSTERINAFDDQSFYPASSNKHPRKQQGSFDQYRFVIFYVQDFLRSILLCYIYLCFRALSYKIDLIPQFQIIFVRVTLEDQIISNFSSFSHLTIVG